MSQADYSKHLEKMIQEITSLSEQSKSQILSEAEMRRKEILAEAEAEAKRIESEIASKAEEEARQNVRRDVSKKKLSIQMDYLNLREQVIEGIMANVHKELQKLTKSKSYLPLMERLLEESLFAINGGDLVLTLRSEDKGIFSQDKLNELTSKVSAECKISLSDKDLNSIGGLVLTRNDGLISVDNTFEKIIERKNDEIRKVIVSQLLN